MAQHLILEGAAPSTPSAGYLSVYASTDGRLNCKDDAGVAFTPPYKNGADVASATTLDLDSATGDWVDVTGTTTITAITLAQGKECTVRFTGVLTLTHGASLVLPNNGSNITTAAGDCAIFRGDASSVVRCISYQRVSGDSLAGETGIVKLNSGTVSAAATLDIDMTAYTAYRHKRFVFHMLPATDAVTGFIRFSSDGGSTFDSGAGNYNQAFTGLDSNATVVDSGTGNTSINLTPTGNVGNASNEGMSGHVDIYDTTDTALYTSCCFQVAIISADVPARLTHVVGSGARWAAQDTDAIRFAFSSGNIASGVWILYGWN